MKRQFSALLVAAAALISQQALATTAEKPQSDFYLGANIGYGINLLPGYDGNKGVYGITAGWQLDDIWAIESDFHYWHGSQEFPQVEPVGVSDGSTVYNVANFNVDTNTYALDIAAKARYVFTPTFQAFVKLGYSYIHSKTDADISYADNVSSAVLHASFSDSSFRPVMSVGLQSDYGRYFSTLTVNKFVADDEFDLSAVSVGFGYRF
ncbi:porin family protein [Shewanella avicenniae]|uniref:Porin family protein n=1 Tax=Shewanella avicenniae TaxID=2814294 RepID=A0ABX7QLD9_9GAMM|nr:outer membrane beta-barrel protein [Shewanella avicenniae]QSX32266.1 porin family protein [Shewanella avicenniae]